MTDEYRARELTNAEREWNNARAKWETAATKKAKREAADDLEFWGNKTAFLSKLNPAAQ